MPSPFLSLVGDGKFQCPFCRIWHGAHGAHHCQKAIPGRDVLVSPASGVAEAIKMESFIVSLQPLPEVIGA